MNFRRLLTGAGALFFAVALTTGGASASAAQSHHSKAASTTTTTKPHAKKPATKAIFAQSLTGTKHTKSFHATTKWQLAFYYNCSGKKGKFTLYLRPKGKHSIKVTSQSGLGGGGARIYAAGHYSLAATTTCKWTVKATKKK
ncbi:MAG: hypothetical protein ACLP62_01090 [Acidimicrobiales bacterium]